MNPSTDGRNIIRPTASTVVHTISTVLFPIVSSPAQFIRWLENGQLCIMGQHYLLLYSFSSTDSTTCTSSSNSSSPTQRHIVSEQWIPLPMLPRLRISRGLPDDSRRRHRPSSHHSDSNNWSHQYFHYPEQCKKRKTMSSLQQSHDQNSFLSFLYLPCLQWMCTLTSHSDISFYASPTTSTNQWSEVSSFTLMERKEKKTVLSMAWSDRSQLLLLCGKHHLSVLCISRFRHPHEGGPPGAQDSTVVAKLKSTATLADDGEGDNGCWIEETFSTARYWIISTSSGQILLYTLADLTCCHQFQSKYGIQISHFFSVGALAESQEVSTTTFSFGYACGANLCLQSTSSPEPLIFGKHATRILHCQVFPKRRQRGSATFLSYSMDGEIKFWTLGQENLQLLKSISCPFLTHGAGISWSPNGVFYALSSFYQPAPTSNPNQYLKVQLYSGLAWWKELLSAEMVSNPTARCSYVWSLITDEPQRPADVSTHDLEWLVDSNKMEYQLFETHAREALQQLFGSTTTTTTTKVGGHQDEDEMRKKLALKSLIWKIGGKRLQKHYVEDIWKGIALSSSSSDKSKELEYCPMCDQHNIQPQPYASLAECAQGHVFSRCFRTYQAITSPAAISGIAKWTCSRCEHHSVVPTLSCDICQSECSTVVRS